MRHDKEVDALIISKEAYNRGYITTGEVADLLGVNVKAAQRLLKWMEYQGYLSSQLKHFAGCVNYRIYKANGNKNRTFDR